MEDVYSGMYLTQIGAMMAINRHAYASLHAGFGEQDSMWESLHARYNQQDILKIGSGYLGWEMFSEVKSVNHEVALVT